MGQGRWEDQGCAWGFLWLFVHFRTHGVARPALGQLGRNQGPEGHHRPGQEECCLLETKVVSRS